MIFKSVLNNLYEMLYMVLMIVSLLAINVLEILLFFIETDGRLVKMKASQGHDVRCTMYHSVSQLTQ